MSDREDSAPDDGDVPRIVVCHLGSQPALLEHIEHGIEEEGVPRSIQRVEADESDPDNRGDAPTGIAHRAASDSGLKIGIGVSESGSLVLHHARLPAGEPLLTVTTPTTLEARTIGTNAARVAKRMPLKPLD